MQMDALVKGRFSNPIFEGGQHVAELLRERKMAAEREARIKAILAGPRGDELRELRAQAREHWATMRSIMQRALDERRTLDEEESDDYDRVRDALAEVEYRIRSLER